MHAARSLLLAALATTAMSAHAAWPDDRPIEVYVGFAAGGGTDLLARAMAPYLQKHLGGKARIIVVNKPGASGEIAYSSLSRAAADGYTIGIVSTPSLLTIPIQRKPKYDVAAIVPLARVIDDPAMFVVAGDSKLASMADVVKQLKANPEGLSMGSNGIGTNGHMAALALQQATGAKVNHIPFAGTSQTKTSLLGHHIDLMAMSTTEYTEADRASKDVKALAQLGNERRPGLVADVPTAREQKLDIVISSERGFAAPRGLPPDVARRLQDAIEATTKDPEFLARAVNEVRGISYLSGAAWTQHMATQRGKFESLWKIASAK
ncbi:tripartite tricarboxylate transporter substrate binding protein [Cupriavidus pauculus]|uniref:tripartite tricarboxylate transporter substrate binding protein n=1 Tax=Cupriavidus pauculus TaxID=82633 RepID=UPI001EE1851E|nr:tripartite tricarboxylate transporter substrate binding protein [Cupriavidus pauculus]GJG94033.1 tripartite tricarboxylate transporter substrate binding protein [Cupriavidus pauculus]